MHTYVYVYVYVYIHTCIYVCILYMYSCTRMYAYVYLYGHEYTHTHTHTHAHTHTHPHTRTHTRTDVCWANCRLRLPTPANYCVRKRHWFVTPNKALTLSSKSRTALTRSKRFTAWRSLSSASKYIFSKVCCVVIF